jgi:hypothetical protein
VKKEIQDFLALIAMMSLSFDATNAGFLEMNTYVLNATSKVLE